MGAVRKKSVGVGTKGHVRGSTPSVFYTRGLWAAAVNSASMAVHSPPKQRVKRPKACKQLGWLYDSHESGPEPLRKMSTCSPCRSLGRSPTPAAAAAAAAAAGFGGGLGVGGGVDVDVCFGFRGYAVFRPIVLVPEALSVD